MKKITLLVIGLLMAFGFAAHASQAHAETSIPASQAMGEENVKILQQSLTILGTVLNEVDTKIDTNSLLADPATVSATLSALKGGLLALHSTIASLDSQTRKLAEDNALVSPAPAIAAAPQARPSNEVLKAPAAASPALTETKNNAVASAGLTGNLAGFLWPTIIVLAVVAGIFFLKKRKPEKAENLVAERKEQEDPDSFSYLPHITDY